MRFDMKLSSLLFPLLTVSLLVSCSNESSSLASLSSISSEEAIELEKVNSVTIDFNKLSDIDSSLLYSSSDIVSVMNSCINGEDLFSSSSECSNLYPLAISDASGSSYNAMKFGTRDVNGFIKGELKLSFLNGFSFNYATVRYFSKASKGGGFGIGGYVCFFTDYPSKEQLLAQDYPFTRSYDYLKLYSLNSEAYITSIELATMQAKK